MKFSIRRKVKKIDQPKDFLDRPILQVTPKDFLTIRDSFNGIHVFGAIGSGKTSGAGRAIAGAYLRAGYGGLVLCAKPTEVDLWRDYCKQHGRESSMIVFDETRHFNFLSYIFAVKGADAANAATDTLLRILKASDHAAGQGDGKEGEKFWVKTTREMILNSVSAIYSAYGTVTVEDIVKFVSTMPRVEPPTEEARQQAANTFALTTLVKCHENPVHPLPAPTLARVRNYWFYHFIGMADKTRASIVTSVTAELNRFTDGILRECFCTTTDILPEMSMNGAIIILAFPALTYFEEGVVAQQLFKLIWQRAIESRNGLPKQFQELPTFLYSDEAQFFVSQYDDTFLSTCRGSRCAVVYLTQSLPTYVAQLGKEKEAAVDGFVGKFNTKVFHLNACPKTNEYAAELIGKGLKLHKTSSRTVSSGIQTNRGGTQNSINHGYNLTESSNETTGANEQLDYFLRPIFFATALKTGSPKNNFLVSAVLFKAGGNFSEPMPDTNSNTLEVTFSQR